MARNLAGQMGGLRTYSAQLMGLKRKQGESQGKRGRVREDGRDEPNCDGWLIGGGDDERNGWRRSMKEWKTTISGGETSTNI